MATRRTATTKKTPTKPTKPTRRASTTASSVLWKQYYDDPDPDLLRVYADALEEEGDPRGPFLQLCLMEKPTAAQQKAKRELVNKSKRRLAGPGTEYLREVELGANGLVAYARTEIGQVLDHVAEISQVNPRLVLTISSLKTLKQAQEVANVPLGSIYFVDFGLLSFSDKELEALAPALANVRHLQLPCRGTKAFTPDALRTLGRHLKQLRFLSIHFYSTRHRKPPEYGRVIAEEPGFATLRGLDFEGMTERDLPGRKLVLNPRLFYNGDFSKKTRMAIKAGVDFVDQLEAVLA
jgi:hypothetical protein